MKLLIIHVCCTKQFLRKIVDPILAKTQPPVPDFFSHFGLPHDLDFDFAKTVGLRQKLSYGVLVYHTPS